MSKEGMVELPDMERVRAWFDANKPEVTYRIRMQSIPNTSEVRVGANINSEEMQWILMLKFCMALRKGEV